MVNPRLTLYMIFTFTLYRVSTVFLMMNRMIYPDSIQFVFCIYFLIEMFSGAPHMTLSIKLIIDNP